MKKLSATVTYTPGEHLSLATPTYSLSTELCQLHYAPHLMAVSHELVNEMRTNKSGSSSYLENHNITMMSWIYKQTEYHESTMKLLTLTIQIYHMLI